MPSNPTLLLAAAEAGDHVEIESWRVRQDGSRFWAKVIVNAERDDVGALLGYTEFVRDLTALRRLAVLE